MAIPNLSAIMASSISGQQPSQPVSSAFPAGMNGALEGLYGGTLSAGMGGQNKKSRAERSYALGANLGLAAARPGMQIMQDYALPAFQGSYEAAQGLDRLPEMASVYEAIRNRMTGQQARYGMAGSGAAFGQDRALARDFSVSRQNEALRARALKQAALAQLSNSAIGAGLGATGVAQQGLNSYGNFTGNWAMMRNQQRAQQNMANQQATGQLIGGAADLGLAYLTGGMSLPFTGVGGMGGMNAGANRVPQTTGGGNYNYMGYP